MGQFMFAVAVLFVVACGLVALIHPEAGLLVHTFVLAHCG